ncbi:universal stress protein [Companilactobacillus keshanensis]|uniref:Universal stress protein n=1 Tax=Companilactobacillus keshanensis TaxID=2486003 RepID=A0ABW4BUP6_9LACO|nr:universal stress protein [Companilactobacillus keshanensis]
MFKKILVALDGSPVSFRALEISIDMAKRCDSKIVVTSIANVDSIPVNVGVDYMPDLIHDINKQTNQILNMAEQQLINLKMFYQVISKEGDPKSLIAKVIPDGVNADLIIMGKTGKGMMTKTFMGSVARYVSENSELPVMLVP